LTHQTIVSLTSHTVLNIWKKYYWRW